MNKKFVCTALAAALCLGALAGCGGSKVDQAAIDALNGQLEDAAHNYNALAEVVAELGSVRQQEEFADAKEDLDEITAEINGGKLDAEDVAELTADLNELMTTITTIGNAVNANAPEEDEVVDLVNDLEETATILSGVAENIAENGGEYQKQLIAGYQETVSDFDEEVTNNGIDAERAKAIDFELEMIKEAAESINERVNAGQTAVDVNAVSDELESLATLVSGASANIMAGDDQIKKDYMTNITNQLLELQEKLTTGELSDSDARDILDGADVVRELVEAIND